MRITELRLKDLTFKDIVILLLVIILLTVATIPMMIPSETSMTSYGNVSMTQILQVCPGEKVLIIKAEGRESHLDVVYRTYSYPIVGKVKETRDCTMYISDK